MKLIIAAVSGIATLGVLWVFFRPPFGENIVHLDTQQRVVALTYDDGPSPPYTDPLLDVLAKHDVKATFFLIGNRVEQYPETVHRILAEGHQVGNHSYSHPVLGLLPPAAVGREIERTDALLRDIGVKGEIVFRAPILTRFLPGGVGTREAGPRPHQWECMELGLDDTEPGHNYQNGVAEGQAGCHYHLTRWERGLWERHPSGNHRRNRQDHSCAETPGIHVCAGIRHSPVKVLRCLCCLSSVWMLALTGCGAKHHYGLLLTFRIFSRIKGVGPTVDRSLSNRQSPGNSRCNCSEAS